MSFRNSRALSKKATLGDFGVRMSTLYLMSSADQLRGDLLWVTCIEMQNVENRRARRFIYDWLKYLEAHKKALSEPLASLKKKTAINHHSKSKLGRILTYGSSKLKPLRLPIDFFTLAQTILHRLSAAVGIGEQAADTIFDQYVSA